jgi:hypothetical protein
MSENKTAQSLKPFLNNTFQEPEKITALFDSQKATALALIFNESQKAGR